MLRVPRDWFTVPKFSTSCASSAYFLFTWSVLEARESKSDRMLSTEDFASLAVSFICCLAFSRFSLCLFIANIVAAIALPSTTIQPTGVVKRNFARDTILSPNPLKASPKPIVVTVALACSSATACVLAAFANSAAVVSSIEPCKPFPDKIVLICASLRVDWARAAFRVAVV